MIQRVQSLFLLGVALCMIAFLFLPIWLKTGVDPSQQLHMNAFGLSTPQGPVQMPYLALSIAAIVSVIIAISEMFMYNNRLNQMKMGALNSFVMAITLGGMLYFMVQAEPLLDGPKGDFQLGFYFPVAAMILNIVANRFIRRDELLVRSVDRIR